MNSTTKNWILRIVLAILGMMLMYEIDNGWVWIYIPFVLVIAGFIFTFFKNPFEKSKP